MKRWRCGPPGSGRLSSRRRRTSCTSARVPVPKLAMAAPPVDLRRVIPNWRDFSVYSAIERLSPRCLAAEFLRRNHNYQRWWRDHVDYEGYIDLDGLSRFVDLDGLSRFGLVNPIDINGVPRIT